MSAKRILYALFAVFDGLLAAWNARRRMIRKSDGKAVCRYRLQTDLVIPLVFPSVTQNGRQHHRKV
jgi:hypothetical protein